ncbi:MAG: hypothetical protein QXS75_03445 [Thermoplasmatales archaeon]
MATAMPANILGVKNVDLGGRSLPEEITLINIFFSQLGMRMAALATPVST